MHLCLLGGEPLLAGSYVATIVFIFSLHTIYVFYACHEFSSWYLGFPIIFFGLSSRLEDWVNDVETRSTTWLTIGYSFLDCLFRYGIYRDVSFISLKLKIFKPFDKYYWYFVILHLLLLLCVTWFIAIVYYRRRKGNWYIFAPVWWSFSHREDGFIYRAYFLWEK